MSSKDYKKAVIDSLLKKYNQRCAKNIHTNRRIILKPAEVYRDYAKNNAEITEKQCLHEAVSELMRLGFVTVDHLKFSEDIDKIYLCEEQLQRIYEYLKEHYGIIPQAMISKQIKQLEEQYRCKGELAQKYCETIFAQLEDPRNSLALERVEANLKMICFLETNDENLYVREASMLVYGDSKWFENNNYDEICTFLRNATGMLREEYDRNDAILGFFHVSQTEQEIFIKGDWRIEWEEYVLETSKLPGGVAIASGDIGSIRRIRVQSSGLLTIENKTSYQRLNSPDCAMMYLGGFANRHQIRFLKKAIADNPNVNCRHFGDIDIGGFLIHKHLCRATGKDFAFYCMGVSQLQDARFQHCLKDLTENDIGRMEALMEDTPYSEVIKYMREHSVKLEQEIVSYYLERDRKSVFHSKRI